MSEGGSARRRRGAGIRLGRGVGVPIIVEPIWFIIVVVIAVGFRAEVERQVPSLDGVGSYAVSLTFVLLLYASVLVHEISHVAVAQALGMQVRRIVLQMLGGVSEVEEERPGSASREYLVAAVGALTSRLLGGIGPGGGPLFVGRRVARP